MDFSRLLSRFADDFALLRAAVAGADPSARVPSCPAWSVGELARHVAEVYLHKAECIRLKAFPEEWPPGVLDPDPLTSLDRTHAVLAGQFSAHSPGDPAATWHEPDQTVGFWIRRMAQETVIHRVDAELAAGLPVSPIPDDLALDGVDEVLKLFVGYGSTVWPDEFGTLLDAPDERPLSVSASHHAWTLRAVPRAGDRPGHVSTTDAATGFDGDALVSGDPAPLLLWLWNRADDASVRLSGDEALLKQFHALRTAATQ
ncbi:maleylpyruvate isomerase N-terminal domain-containing protein [Sphaerisporangium sp. TRM90804]|uniref:maleylpyruvate isomerase N-terminal domain-containing protein n=1 Tax=Sphaerisporangium sp. TRM90804 TaxID=3031113 RepID=UPI002448AA45|nr:maleylpyruvate isomerase N-terminal domain-containing protein [Sphaerisporangium sp. TRM90804]MDH2429960.1 maleylpyruvate isomerase N-terminal domain-containing protein [Sphaerisporangium sp. TRM90804]